MERELAFRVVQLVLLRFRHIQRMDEDRVKKRDDIDSKREAVHSDWRECVNVDLNGSEMSGSCTKMYKGLR